MSTGGLSSKRSQSSLGRRSVGKSSSASTRHLPPPTTLTPENADAPFEPCAATASYLLYSQRNRILVLHHETLAIEKRFDLHREDVVWIAVDNISERGSGRLAVSYDAGNMAIVWDILTGGEIARFSAYEQIKVASFMRNGNIAFGNEQGNIILFEPSTSEHISARTIFDPITAIAPSADCLTFAIGYMNGSILIATLQPSFTILHTLSSNRAPSRIMGLAWHGSSSKQKTDMLATQTLDSDLRVWSVPKPPHHEPPSVIRVLQRSDFQQPGPCWFAWSKNGRIVQYADGETRSWDVRTKKISYDIVPTVEGVVGLTSHGPSGKLFTLSRNHGVQEYDLNPGQPPVQVASVQHIPANTPPTPPTTFDAQKELPTSTRAIIDAAVLPSASDTGESSTDEGATRSPLQRIAREMESLDAMEDELRDKVMPLSPVSSRASSVSSKSSGGRRRNRKYLYDKPDSSRAPSSVGGSTEFSLESPALKLGHDSMSIRSVSSLHSTPRQRASNLRNQVLRSPEDSRSAASMDLFPSARGRLRDVPFRPPHYGNVARTPELLQREMLSVLFGWNDTARSLVRDEMQRHKPGSPATILLAKWLGDIGADMASMIGSESMTSSDWMMLALSSIGIDSQKKVGEAFVQRLLEKGDVHPAVAILVGLGENNDAIEVYVSQKFYLEAVLLTCVTCPSDWQRISHLIREWGAIAVQLGQSELAVRCFSCTSIETSEPWFSPRAQDAAYAAQQEHLTRPPSVGPPLASPPLSPPSRSGSHRLAQKNASLKLITSFGDKGAPIANTIGNTLDLPTPTNNVGVTPIAQSAMPFSAMSPSGTGTAPWQQGRLRQMRDPVSAITAAPGDYRNRIPSRSDIERVKEEASRIASPITAARETAPSLSRPSSRRTPSLGSNSLELTTALQPTVYNDPSEPMTAVQGDNHLPSPSAGAFGHVRRNTSQERKPEGLTVQVVETRYDDNASLGPSTDRSLTSPPMRGKAASVSSKKSAGGRSIDDYIAGVEEAMEREREHRARSKARAESKKREGSRGRRTGSRPRELSATRGPNDVRYIKPAKRSPSSPIPMSPEEIAQASQAARPKPEPATSEDESFYKVGSPVESHKSLKSFRSEPKPARRPQSPERRRRSDTVDSKTGLPASQDTTLILDTSRGRQDQRQPGSTARSPSSPLPMQNEPENTSDRQETNSDGQRVRLRADSHTGGDSRPSTSRRDRSVGRKPREQADSLGLLASDIGKSSVAGSSITGSAVSGLTGLTDESEPRARLRHRKELAAKELEERRLSLARRPSAPSIPLPGQHHARPPMAPRANTENSPTSYAPHLSRAQSVDPEQLTRHGKITAPIGLPATPRAMRHPRYMGTDPAEREEAPPVPEIPENASALSSMGSSLSQMSYSNLASTAPSYVMSNLTSNLASNMSSSASYLTSNVSSYGSSALGSEVSSNVQYDEGDNLAPLLPSTVFGQKAPYNRSATAPPEKSMGYKSNAAPSTRKPSQVRKIAPPEAHEDRAGALPGPTSIDEALANSSDQVVIIPEPENPPMLPELQHLAGPPPPPPPPSKLATQLPMGSTNNSGVINIAVGDNEPQSAVEVPMTLPSTTYPQPMERDTMAPMSRAMTASPTAQRRGRGSVSESFGSRFRDLSDRMRSTSRNRVRGPGEYQPAPYESLPPPPMPPGHYRRESENRAKSPYEQAMADRNRGQIPPPPPPPSQPFALPEGRLDETTIPPSTLPRSQSAMGGYRNPKEIRANMPPETLQQGVYPGHGGYL